ncbi:unnamed protein product [Candidula unifasciata]|uniref:Uncharacterized protein n=1 Tax=Candidula unifasciata TaxID=100452 RepID=A0A8S4A384_9EUPU|nr:unnamed protein product [Candidula unifasciata]
MAVRHEPMADTSVEQMAAVDPLPILTPLEPIKKSLLPDEDKWPCELPKTRQTIQERFPRKKDWMHDWANSYYMVGDGGAKTKK